MNSTDPHARDFHGFEAFSPREVAGRVEKIGVAKIRLPLLARFMLGVLAGGFIGLGALYYTLVTCDSVLGFTLTRLLGGLVFSMGYIVAIVAGAEVFTSNNLQIMSWAAGKVSLAALLRHWGVLLAANAVGAAGLAVIVLLSGSLEMNDRAMAVRALEIAVAKASLPFHEAFFRGVLGNQLVCLAVWMSMAGRTVTDKTVAMILPLSAVAALNLEHVGASLYYIPRAMMLRVWRPEIQVPGLEQVGMGGLFSNLVPVTLGNIVGGSLMIARAYYLIYRRRSSRGRAA